MALLTTGSPHLGSPLAWIYQWLDDHPRTTPISDDWKIVDWLKGLDTPLDLRRPVIGQLMDGGPTITTLNSLVTSLPATIRYGEITYHDCLLGYLQLHPFMHDYSVFEGKTLTGTPPLPDGTAAYLLRTDGTPSAKTNAIYLFRGDGLIPERMQKFTQLLANAPQFANQIITPRVVLGGQFVHIDEPSQVLDIYAQLQLLVDWWQ